MKYLFLLVLSVTTFTSHCQEKNSALSVEKIMRDPKWIGSSPSSPYWSADGKYLFFSWNPDKAEADSTYFLSVANPKPAKASREMLRRNPASGNAAYTRDRTAWAYSSDGDIYYEASAQHKLIRVTNTVDEESNPVFSFNETKLVFQKGQDLFSWNINDGEIMQLTDFQKKSPPKKETLSNQETWLHNQQLELFDVLKTRHKKKQETDSVNKLLRIEKPLHTIYLDDKRLSNLRISPEGRFITYRMMKTPENVKSTVVPSYVTETGFTEEIDGRTKVGAPQGNYSFYVFDRNTDTVMKISSAQIPGINDLPDYVKDYPGEDSLIKAAGRGIIINGPWWSPKGNAAIVDIRAQDNKDRWLMLLDPATGKLKLLDRQRDEAWVSGPGIGFSLGGASQGWIDEENIWFQSEATGYSHLYTVNISTGKKTALTSGSFEVQQAVLSPDKKYFYLSTNAVHPGELQLYRILVTGSTPEKITSLTGSNVATISPDGKNSAVLYSYSNKPWELYLQENIPQKKPVQITNLAASEEFKAYAWRDPEIITITARDGAKIYARLYRSSGGISSKPAVIFVHGAGYLQNAHKWWSSYFREYMFNNLLADQGYTVLDMDYRGSAGYGRDWRTGIYRHMGGKDLDDQVDGAKYLVEKLGVDPKRIGIYGGSYGGFITLMALFTAPDVFAAGAGLRCVTDWAAYNHGYTSNILNEPFYDSIAYKKSSPINFAHGLKTHLLMCHGMIDVNVHFQDIVRLTQRLIELGKNNWELAVFPLEDHGFVEPSSWTDEYKRILKLFNTYLRD